VQPSFDASIRKTGPASFGHGADGVNTPWTDTHGDIWLRKEFTTLKGPLITLPEEPMQRLKELATEAGIAPEELLRANVERWLTGPREDFTQAAAYVLEKNAELYLRLAR